MQFEFPAKIGFANDSKKEIRDQSSGLRNTLHWARGQCRADAMAISMSCIELFWSELFVNQRIDAALMGFSSRPRTSCKVQLCLSNCIPDAHMYTDFRLPTHSIRTYCGYSMLGILLKVSQIVPNMRQALFLK